MRQILQIVLSVQGDTLVWQRPKVVWTLQPITDIPFSLLRLACVSTKFISQHLTKNLTGFSSHFEADITDNEVVWRDTL